MGVVGIGSVIVECPDSHESLRNYRNVGDPGNR